MKDIHIIMEEGMNEEDIEILINMAKKYNKPLMEVYRLYQGNYLHRVMKILSWVSEGIHESCKIIFDTISPVIVAFGQGVSLVTNQLMKAIIEAQKHDNEMLMPIATDFDRFKQSIETAQLLNKSFICEWNDIKEPIIKPIYANIERVKIPQNFIKKNKNYYRCRDRL